MMSFKAVAWTLLAAVAFSAVLLFNYWAAYQPLSTLVYTGLVLALCGLANLVVPFRFLGVRKRAVGALMLTGGVALFFAALAWPASTIRVAQPRTRLDEIMPEYQFVERHSTRIHARSEQVMQAVRESTGSDMKSLITFLKIRGAVLRQPDHKFGEWMDRPVLDAFKASGYLLDGNEHEVAMFGVANTRTMSRPDVHSLQEFADYREQGAVKMAFDFHVEEAGGGWSTLTTETRMAALGDSTRRGASRYWRLIVPGSGLLRLQWLEGIKKRAESMRDPRS